MSFFMYLSVAKLPNSFLEIVRLAIDIRLAGQWPDLS